MIDTLMKLGLSSSEALVYMALVEKGPCFVAPLVHHTKKHRQIVYNALETLQKKDLITVSKKNGKNYYAIGEPKRFLIDIKQKEVLAEQLAERIEKRVEAGSERVEVFQGPESYAQGLADFRLHAQEAKEYIIIGGEPEDWFEYTRSFFPEHVAELRKLRQQGIDILILFYETERASAEKFIKPYLNDPYILKIAKAEYRLPQTGWLAGEHVYIVTPTSDFLVIHVKSKSLSEQYRDYFWKQWATAKRIEK